MGLCAIQHVTRPKVLQVLLPAATFATLACNSIVRYQMRNRLSDALRLCCQEEVEDEVEEAAEEVAKPVRSLFGGRPQQAKKEVRCLLGGFWILVPGTLLSASSIKLEVSQ